MSVLAIFFLFYKQQTLSVIDYHPSFLNKTCVEGSVLVQGIIF